VGIEENGRTFKMEPQEKHTMMIAKTYPNGAEEWVCPTCGLRFVMQWPPVFKKIILEEGDPNAIHSGGKGGVVIGIPQMKPLEKSSEADEEIESSIDETTLNPWREYFNNMNINDRLDQ
jgi:hypothetical protein